MYFVNVSYVPSTDEPIGGLAAKVARRDTLAMRLSNRNERTDSSSNTDSSMTSSMSEDEKSALKVNLTR